MIKHIKTEEEFNEVIKSGSYLVDFYADWCGPCKMLTPILETIEEIEVLKINVDELNLLSSKYGVMSIPTLIHLKDGKEAGKIIGFKSKEEILKLIAE